jgi:ATP-dependent Lon protease
MTLKEKIIANFEGKVVRKDLTALVKGNNPVPAYVLEFLLGQYCAIDDDELINKGVDKVREVIRNNYVHRSDSEVVKHKIRSTGNHKIIDKISVELNDDDNIYEAEFANLGLKKVPVSDNMVDANKKLLSGGGVWCIITMSFSHADNTDVRWVIVDLKPIQIANIDLDEYIDARGNFETDEWIDLLMHSVGLDPEYFSKRDKFIQLSRLITHVENNYNFIELGPKGTGKSHIFSELSPHGVLVSGGDVSKARLFVNNSGDKIGLVGYWDVVALDEFEQEKGGKRTDGDLVKIMQNYMANQSFNRGKETYQATASMAFVGNTKHNVPYMLKNSHLFESIPEGYIKGAFLDRMHMYVPGWEVRILKSSVFSKEYGFIVDYLAEILRELRKADYSSLLDGKITLHGSLTTRDKTAIRKSFSGLAKLIYPNKKMTDSEVCELLDFAVEGRKRVKDQLYKIDETFKSEPVEFSYTVVSSGKEVSPETLENQNYLAAVTAKEEQINEDNPDAQAPQKPAIRLEPHQTILRDNQTGISYKKLFADYLKGAKYITMQDPYIRMPYQFKNFLEFCMMLGNIKSPDEVINLEVVTWNNEEHIEESKSNLDELQESLHDLGINLTYRIEEHHDRFIAADNGWKITLGRGLDIFEKIEGRYNVAGMDQTKRKCKSCELTYLRI